MPRLGPGLLTALTAWVLLAGAGQGHASHVQCGDVIRQDTKLDSDLAGCPGDGIVIGASDITLDLGGHTIRGDAIEGPLGLECEGGVANGNSPARCARPSEGAHDGVTIQNGTVRDFDVGILFEGGDEGTFRNLTLTGSWSGLRLDSFAGAVIEHNRMIGNQFGMRLSGASFSTIARNLVSGNVDGFESDGLDYNQIVGNRFVRNVGSGIHAHGGGNNVLARNQVRGNGDVGIEVSDGVHDNLVSANHVSGNASAGILVRDGAHRNLIERNSVSHNGKSGLSETDFMIAGIVVEGDARIEGNRVFANRRGISVCCTDDSIGVEGLIVSGNRADRNLDDGIDVDGVPAILTHNQANRNTDLGIEAMPGVTDGGRNRAFGNGNPLQCLYVACR